MPHWLLKSAIHRVISLLPGTHRLNELFQTRVTRSIHLSDEHFAGLLKHAARHLDVRFRRCGKGDFTALEVGTGWFPVCPLAAVLCGATRVWTFDIAPLLESRRLEKMLEYFRVFARDGRLAALLPGLRPDRLVLLDKASGRLGDPTAVLKNLGIEYRVCDARNTGLPSDSVDFFFRIRCSSTSLWIFSRRCSLNFGASAAEESCIVTTFILAANSRILIVV